jgi:hypothetical protein
MADVRRSGSTDSTGLTKVRAGRLHGWVVGPEIRYLAVGPDEIIRRLHVAVRDTEWRTIPVEPLTFDLRASGSRFEFELDGRADPAWAAMSVRTWASGGADGVTLAMEAQALEPIDYCRIGICVLLPTAPYAGRTFQSQTGAGTGSGRLPVLVAPQRMISGRPLPLAPAFTRFTTRLDSGLRVDLRFVGDDFEIEDQRNWADGSYKIYSTPLERGFQHHLAAGAVIAQSVRLGVS